MFKSNQITPLSPDVRELDEKATSKFSTLTTSKKSLIFEVIILFVAFVVFLGLFIAYCVKYKEAKESAAAAAKVCQTFDCLDSAAYIAKSMNTSVDPCEDFYQFACGRWIADHPMAADDITVDAFSLIEVDIKQTLEELLNLDDPAAPEAVKQARNYFRSCQDLDTIEKLGKKPLLDLLRLNGSGIYPTLQPTWTDTGMTFSDIVEYLTNVSGDGSNAFMIMGVMQDQMQSDNHIILFSITKPELPSLHMYLGQRNTTELKFLENLYRQVLEALGADTTTAAQDAKDVVDFEIQLAYALSPLEKQRSGVHRFHKMSLANLTKTFPQFDWLGYLRRQFNRTGENYNITMDEMVATTELEYYTKFFALVHKTSKRTLLNYGVWRHVYSALPYLDKELRDLKTNFTNVLYGTLGLQERWKSCVQQTDASFPYAVGRLYVDKRFSPEDKQRMEQMIESLIRAFREMLQHNTWMTQPTREEALKKLSFVTKKIGYPDFILKDSALNARSDMYKVDLHNFFGTTIEIAKINNILMLKMLRKAVDRTEWSMSASAVGAYHTPANNEIVFSAGILNPPFYSRKFSDAHIYGSIGTIIAHELTHGFDTQGSAYDEKGNLRQWWQENDLKNFQTRIQCMVDQYSQFVDKELNMAVNGYLTIGENIADCEGIQESFRAYRSAIKEKGREEDKYPTLPYTQNQLFFIGFAQVWCSNALPKYRAVNLQTDSHSPAIFRVLGAIQNSEEFGQVFNCPVGTPMNPEKKCQVW